MEVIEETIKCEKYRPLPEGLYIGMSNIEGNGLFTLEELSEDVELGISHIKYDSGDFHSNYIRTPLVGFVNHDELNPNCTLYECGDYLKMKTIKLIRPGGELTLNYNLHEPCKNYMTKVCNEKK